jgi:hypothetical protein
VLDRLEEKHRVELAQAYGRWRATARDTKGRVLRGKGKSFHRTRAAGGRMPRSGLWGNAQTAVNEQNLGRKRLGGLIGNVDTAEMVDL